MSIITLTTDLGTKDHKVASIKGSILSLEKNVPIVDITHHIEPHDIIQTAYIVRNSYSHFPKGSIHMIAVDCFYHKDRKFLVLEANGHYFIMPDNGLFSLIFPEIKPEKIYEISHKASDDDRIFTPIDIFVPVAVHLYKGNDIKLIGKQIKSIKEVVFPKPNYNEAQKMIAGEIVYIDHFGNAVSNISKEIFEKHLSENQNFTIKFRECSMKNIVKKHTDIITDWEKENLFLSKELALFNEADLLEIAMYKGSKTNGAAPLMGLNIGEKIYVEFS
jgi:hypothetical protein